MGNSLNLQAWRNSRVKVDKVIQTINEYNMIADSKNIVVGLSGGADSVCLLHILCSLKNELGLTIYACHINHMLRAEESGRDEEFCKELCEDMCVPLEIFRVNVSDEAKINKESIELCARRIRYDLFKKCAVKYNALIATAHTMSDSVETVLFNMMRGTSLKGICGIPPKRDNIIRPLINFTREEVEEYCRENNLKYVIDSTNLTDNYSRNYIRHKIVPLIKQTHKNFHNAFLRMTKTISDDNDFLEKSTFKLLQSAKCENGFLCDILIQSHPALLKRAIATLLKERKLKQDFQTIIAINKIINSKEGKICLSQDTCVIVRNGVLMFFKKNVLNSYFEIGFFDNVAKLPFDEKKVVICEPNKDNLLTFKEFPENYLKNCFDCDKIKGRIFVRQRKDGDKVLLYTRGCTKKLKKLFNESKISLEERSKISIVCDDEGIVWVENFGVSQRCCVDDNTEHFKEIIIMT